MAMVNSRRKGKSGEADLKRLLQDRDWQVFPRPRGEAGDDFTAIDQRGRLFSVECKNTVSLMKSHHDQCKANAKGNRLLAWHPSKWSGFPKGSFVVFLWPEGGRVAVHLWLQKGVEE